MNAVDWKGFIRKAMLYLNIEGCVETFQRLKTLRAFQAPGKARRYEQSLGVLLPYLCDPTGSNVWRGKGWGKGQER